MYNIKKSTIFETTEFFTISIVLLTIIRRRAACASFVTVSASSNIITLKGGLGYFLSADVCCVFVVDVSPSFLLLLLVPNQFFLATLEPADPVEDIVWLPAVPTDKLANCLIFSRTTLIPLSSLAFNSRTRRRHCCGCHSSLHNANY